MISIRSEEPRHVAAVRVVNERAFGQPDEAAIVDRVRKRCEDLVSLVAVDGEAVVGHILFSPATVDGPDGAVIGMGLAPLAVLPERQRQGVGSALVRLGLDRLRERGCPFVVVLGHPEYYPRFGFERASIHGLRSQWDGIPDDVFMVLVLDADRMAGTEGIARYREEFADAT